MTQLSLFESPIAVSVAAPVTVPTKSRRGEVDPGVAASRRAVAAASPEDLERADLGHREGLNKMGDLAKLVILRYELAAKRRHESMARRAASLGS